MPTGTLNSPELLTEHQVAELLNLSIDWVRRARRSGAGPVFAKLGNSVRYDRADVMAWLDARKLAALGKPYVNTTQQRRLSARLAEV